MEIFSLYVHKRKFHMIPMVVALITMIGFTALSQTGLIVFIYPI